ncbi:MAG: hypothetical protein LBJ10_02790 [Clostridiales bacterium]|nr:hypothetical protein [Clostridiales bacterium]
MRGVDGATLRFIEVKGRAQDVRRLKLVHIVENEKIRPGKTYYYETASERPRMSPVPHGRVAPARRLCAPRQ